MLTCSGLTSTTATAASSFDDVTDEQVESFRRDGFLTIEEASAPLTE
jgi:hypothetical protein